MADGLLVKIIIITILTEISFLRKILSGETILSVGSRARAHTHTHTRTHARTHALTHARTHAHTHTHNTRTRAHTHTHAHTRTHARKHARKHTYIHGHTHTHARAHTHTQRHTRTRILTIQKLYTYLALLFWKSKYVEGEGHSMWKDRSRKNVISYEETQSVANYCAHQE